MKINKLLKSRGLGAKDHDAPKMEVPKEVVKKIKAAKSICIVSDYDCDGFASAVILHYCLSHMGKKVTYLIPDRATEGYGITPPVVDRRPEGVDLIITADNGIAATAAVDYVNTIKGLDIIVTDHHAADVSPDCLCVNPNCKDIESPPHKNLCGAQVALVVMLDFLGKKTESINHDRILPWLLTATLCDMVQIDATNYAMCNGILKHLRMVSTNNSFNALLDVLKLDHKLLTVDDFGFKIGPTINAVGRMDDMTRAVEAALKTDYNEAFSVWSEISKFNKERKKKTTEGEEAAVLAENVIINDHIVVVQVDAHEGVIGIIASRLKEKYNKPAVVISKNGKASCRSVPGFHMRDKLIKVSKYLDKYGGHSMAAGFSMKDIKK